jgi:hypothetical protein
MLDGECFKTQSSAANSLSPELPEVAYDVALVDWEKAGWCPSYWEYCSASWSFRFNDDWPEYLERILDPHPVEYSWMHMIVTELWSRQLVATWFEKIGVSMALPKAFQETSFEGAGVVRVESCSEESAEWGALVAVMAVLMGLLQFGPEKVMLRLSG